MKTTYALASLVGAAFAIPQGVTDKISPPGAPPAGCTKSFDGKFEITVAEPSTNGKRSLGQLEKRAECGANGVLVMSLDDGVTLDDKDRVGYIASNFQFQFDKPPQAGAIFTSGFSVCDDNTLALGDSKVFYRCLSGDFYNLYNKNWAAQCEPVHIVAMPCGSGSGSSPPAEGNTVGTTMVQTTVITALSDGQPQVVTTEVPIPLCQIGDGQVQVHTTPCASVPATGAPGPAPTYPVSQIDDGQIQVPPPASTPAGTGPAGPAPTGSAPAGPAPTGSAPAGPAPTDSAPAGSASAGPAPTGSAPAGSAPSGSAPAAPSSSDAGEAPSGTAPEAPGATSPADSAPSTAGSSQVTASVSALIIGAVFAFACL